MSPSFISLSLGNRKILVVRPDTVHEGYCADPYYNRTFYTIIVPGKENAELEEVTRRFSCVSDRSSTDATSTIYCQIDSTRVPVFEKRMQQLGDDYGFPIILVTAHLRTIVFTGNLPEHVISDLELKNDRHYTIVWPFEPDKQLRDQIRQDGRVSLDSFTETEHVLTCCVGRDYGASFEETFERRLQQFLQRVDRTLAS